MELCRVNKRLTSYVIPFLQRPTGTLEERPARFQGAGVLFFGAGALD